MKHNAYKTRYCSVFLFGCALCVIALCIIPSCDDDFSATISQENRYNDNSNPSNGNDNPQISFPVPGNSGFITASILLSGDVKLVWTNASDAITEQSKLLYCAFYSLKSDISTVEGCETLGTPASGWVENATSVTISALDEGKQYFFNIVVATPDSRKAAYSMTSATIPGNMYLYSAAGTYKGNMAQLSSSARATIDAYCAPTKSMSVIVIPSFANYRAFIGISSTDAIKNFPSLYNVPTNWKIKSFSGQIIAYNWIDLLDGSINIKLQTAGVVDTYWWSGSLADGSFDTINNCSSWNDGTNQSNGRTGTHNALEYEWISEQARNCNNTLKLLCVGW